MKRVGIIGCGSIAQVHGWVLAGMEGVSIVAACDLEQARAEDFVRKFAFSQKPAGASDQGEKEQEKDNLGREECSVVTDWKALLDMDLDVVHVCTPHFLHAPMAAKLLERDVAVFMEKPCAISRKQFEQLKLQDERHPGKLGFCFQNRYNETTRVMDDLIREGRIGEVTGARAFVTWRRDESYYQGSDWKGRLATEGGGALINQSIHTLDLMLRHLGIPDQVRATASNHHLQGMVEVEDTVEAWMSFSDGKRACFYASNGYCTDAPVLLEIQGEKGRIMLNDREVTLWTQESEAEHFTCNGEKGIGKSYWGAGHRACIRDFYQSLTKGTPFSVNLQSVENTFDVMMRIYEAAGRGSEITKI